MKFQLIVSLFFPYFFQSFAFAEVTANNLKSMAIAETKIEGQKTKSATTVQVSSGMLTLKDPRPEVITRSWSYVAGIKGQNFSPSGTVNTNIVGTFDLSSAKSTFMPGILIGFESAEITFDTLAYLTFNFGLRADGSFASQATKTLFKSGYSTNESRLNTSILAVGPSISFHFNNLGWKYNPEFSINPQFGNLTYTQTSANEFARFTKLASFAAVNIDLDLPLTKNNTVFAEYSARKLTGTENQLAIQQDNFEVGTKVVW